MANLELTYITKEQQKILFVSGIATGVAPMYISEISPVSIKGAVGVSHQFMITFGILLGFAMSVKQVLS